MPAPRPFALIRTKDQWSRVAHWNTALEGEVAQLSWTDDEQVYDDDDAPQVSAAGLAFDRHCRLYHSDPEEGRVERLLWASHDPLKPHQRQSAPVDLFEKVAPPRFGDFTSTEEMPGALVEPRGLAVDDDDRLFIAETGARRILIYDLWEQQLVRRVQTSSRPLDLATDGRTVYALLSSPAGLVKLNARTGPTPIEMPAGVIDPSRLALSPDGQLFLLDQAGTLEARVISCADSDQSFPVAFATDLEFQTGEFDACPSDEESFVLVVARRAGEDFLRFCIGPTSIDEMPRLRAREYDGRGIVLAPDGRIGFWTARGFRHAVGARVRYASSGRVTTFRLDSGEFQTHWGRIFLDACIPRETSIRIHCVATDEPPEETTLPRTAPVNVVKLEIARPDLSPPMPPLSFVPEKVEQALHRRETGREWPWARHAENDPFETYEAPVIADPGRYLWVTLELTGNTRFTPRFRALRAEYPAHDYLRRIPRTFSRDERVASFLRRYLAIFEGTLGEMEARSDARRALLDPRSAPAEMLPWLAGFLGLVLDERWPTRTSRRVIEEAAWLFRFRGTVRGLARFLEIYTGTRVILMEKYRVRGLGGGVLGEETTAGLISSSILGAGLRVGGAIGEPDAKPLEGNLEDAFRTHAHRFSVIIPASLSAEQLDVVRHILELHRPAHTLFDVCTVDAGMRVGQGLHVALTSIVGRTSGFTPLQLGGALLGRGSLLGSPQAGMNVGSSSLGEDTRVG
jgi:phage tail-like protein